LKVPPSEHFSAIDLASVWNADRGELTGNLAPRPAGDWSLDCFGRQSFRGIAFDMGKRGRPNVVLLTPGASEVSLRFAPRRATYVVFLHAAEDIAKQSPEGFGTIGPAPISGGNDGNALGTTVANYRLTFSDGTTVDRPVVRRFAIQQRHIAWSASGFAAVPARGPYVFSTASEDVARGRAAEMTWGRSLARTNSGRSNDGENLWLYALPNPHPQHELVGLALAAVDEQVVIYGIATTTLTEHPLRSYTRQKLRLDLPDGVDLDVLGELDTDDRNDLLGIDLGTVISARAALDYERSAWVSGAPEVQPQVSPRSVVVEYAAHPAARLYVGSTSFLPMSPAGSTVRVSSVAPASKRVCFAIRDARSGVETAVRLHVHGAAGEYLPPLGHHRKVNPYWFEDSAGELQSGRNQYAYVAGDCEIDVPIGTVFIEISKGYEYAPLRVVAEVTEQTTHLRFDIEQVLDWRSQGWVTSDTHVHFLSPHTALLEGQAEGINVVNLLAAQWGEMFSNVGDFDGRTTLGARDFGGDGEFLVRVGTENRMHVLGHISLLGYDGPMIHPLSTGGPQEGAAGEALDVAMAEWAERCRRQGGLVVMPHAPNPQAERAANIVDGLVDAVELMTFNPRDAQLNPFGLADWYRYQNIGHQLPLVGGSDKMAATSVLGGIRTYVRLGDRPFTYANWMDAVRAGDTFVTVGPLVELRIDGHTPGERIRLGASGGTLLVQWKVESVAVPIDRVELVVGGRVVEDWTVGGLLAAAGSVSLPVVGSTWVALRVRGSWTGRAGDIAAHTSAAQITVGDQSVFAPQDAVAVLQQIEGAMAFVDTLAARPSADRLTAIRMTLDRAHRELHGRLHGAGVAHSHSPLHGHDQVPREH
jgi:hypothetical protein